MLTATIEKRIGARFCRTSRIWMSAQLSLPPDSPTITRSPSSIRLNSTIAFVTFLAILASRSDEYAIREFRLKAEATRAEFRLKAEATRAEFRLKAEATRTEFRLKAEATRTEIRIKAEATRPSSA